MNNPYDNIKQTIRGLQIFVATAELDCKLNIIIKHLGIKESDYPEEFEKIKECEKNIAELTEKEKEIHEEEEKAMNFTAQDLMDAEVDSERVQCL